MAGLKRRAFTCPCSTELNMYAKIVACMVRPAGRGGEGRGGEERGGGGRVGDKRQVTKSHWKLVARFDYSPEVTRDDQR